MNLAWHDSGQLVSHREEGAGCHSSHIVIHVLQTSQDGGREEGQESGTQVLDHQPQRWREGEGRVRKGLGGRWQTRTYTRTCICICIYNTEIKTQALSVFLSYRARNVTKRSLQYYMYSTTTFGIQKTGITATCI